MERETQNAPGLKMRRRKGGKVVPYWVAKPHAIEAGYPIRTVNLTGCDDPAERSRQLEAEMLAWLGRPRQPKYDGTLGSLLLVYETHPRSKFQRLKPASRAPYGVYLRKLKTWYGDKRIERLTGLDIADWHEVWKEPAKEGGEDRLGAAAFARNVLKAALSFGVAMKIPECKNLKEAIAELGLPKPRPRTMAPTAADVTAAREAAHALGRHRVALCMALQFETTARLWDITGQWVDQSEPGLSDVTSGLLKWIGPTWGNIDANMVLSILPSKTAGTTGRKVHVPLSRCPMVMEEIARIPVDERVGPLVVDEKTGLPYALPTLVNVWQRIRKDAGLDPKMWMRDLRAGGITEAQMAGATVEDRAKMAGHSAKVNEAVYARDAVEASGRVVELRGRFRKKDA